MASEPATDYAFQGGPGAFEEEAGHEEVHGLSPWRLALRRLKRNNKVAIVFGVLFLLLVAICLAAPLWANGPADTDPYKNHLTETIVIDGKKTNVVSLDGVPIGPTWQGKFFLGADTNGRDTAVRLLYGGRNSLLIGCAAALITALLAVILGILAGFVRGFTDTVVSRTLDVIWAFPVLLLGVALGTALSLGGLEIGPIKLGAGSKLIPILIIAIVYVPYMARPIRGQVLALREKEFVEAARAQGMRPSRIMLSEILPNLSSTVIVFLPLMVANAILLEAALGFLGVGVKAPEPSWGTMIGDGVKHILSGPHLAIVPGGMLVLTVLALNVFGDGVRDAFDPRSTVRMEH
ncbi:MAG TPA: ABC transporter permease [Thermoleophilaceae bacterium]|nr:ABC transporter permease [Thermoleophilaceae bacterium]